MKLLGVLLANTGIQSLERIVSSVVLKQQKVDPETILDRYSRWNRVWISPSPESHAFVQCKVTRDIDDNLSVFLAVDTATGNPLHGCCAQHEEDLGNGKGFRVALEVAQGSEHGSTETVRLVIGSVKILPSKIFGPPSPVTVVVDIGNSRTSVGILDGGSGGCDLARDLSFVRLGRTDPSYAPPAEIVESRMDLCFPDWRAQDPVKTVAPVRGAQASGRGVTRRGSRGIGSSRRPRVVESASSRQLEGSMLFREHSLARLGARPLRASQTGGAEQGLRTGLSSPKRYLWSVEREVEAWYAFDPASRDGGPLRRPQGALLRYLGPGLTSPPHPDFAKSDLVVLFVFELLLQTFAHVNSWELRRSKGSNRARRIDTIVFTYPSNMTRAELAIFERRVGTATEAFHELVLRPYGHDLPRLRPFDLDEGTVAQLPHVLGRLQGGAGGFHDWVAEVSHDQSVMLGCLDIGGGSIDASLVRYTARPGVVPLSLECDLLYVDGVSVGGDDILRAVIEDIILDDMRRAMRIDADKMDQLVALGRASPAQQADMAFATRLLQDLLYPVAVEYIRVAEGLSASRRVAIPELRGLTSHLLTRCREILESDGRGVPGTPIDQIVLSFDDRRFRAVVGRVIGPSLCRLTRILTARGAAEIVLAGRLSVLEMVRDLVREAAPIPPERVVQCHRLEVLRGTIRARPPCQGWVFDPKLAVPLGAAIAEAACQNRLVDGVKLHLRRTGMAVNGYHWGEVSTATRRFTDPSALLFEAGAGDPDRSRLARRRVEGAVLIGRRPGGDLDLEATPVYELRPAEPGNDSHLVELMCAFDESLQDEVLTAMVDGRPCDETSTPLRFGLRTLYDREYWLDRPLSLD